MIFFIAIILFLPFNQTNNKIIEKQNQSIKSLFVKNKTIKNKTYHFN
ncbi:hypothetical protein PROVRETT_09983 [Providencia rettgeri DSM 1131]|nr:hypothetical protein PROVRETT_09983 [Providencia rettgeri DSM 1131]